MSNPERFDPDFNKISNRPEFYLLRDPVEPEEDDEEEEQE